MITAGRMRGATSTAVLEKEVRGTALLGGASVRMFALASLVILGLLIARLPPSVIEGGPPARTEAAYRLRLELIRREYGPESIANLTYTSLTEPVYEMFQPPASVVVPRTTSVANLYLGPTFDYRVVGLLPRGAVISVVGRNRAGDWLAVELLYGSQLRGWLPRSQTAGVDDVSSLPVVPATSLPSR
jgi:hypothetical protein